jgi:hypothetical protein
MRRGSVQRQSSRNRLRLSTIGPHTMGNNDLDWLEHLAIVDGLTQAEQDAWLRLHLAEAELVAARHHVMEITHRESSKRRRPPQRHIVHASQTSEGGSVA